MQLFHTLWGPPVHESQMHWVFFHGMGGTASLWRPIAAALEKTDSILAVDQRGHGKSRVPSEAGGRTRPGYTPLDYGQDVVQTLQSVHYPPAIWVGHSMGVRTACAAAHLWPAGALGLVLVDLGFSGVAGGGLGEGLARFIRVLPQTFTSRVEARAFMEAHCPDPAIAQYLMAVSQIDSSNGSVRFPFDHDALIATIEAARDVSVHAWVETLALAGKPILVLRGANSLVWNHAEFERERKIFDRPETQSIQFEEMPGAGHGLPFEKRMDFVVRLKQFASQILQTGPLAC